MSLRTKFAVLLGLLALAVLGGAAASAWSFRVLHRETAAPFRDFTGTLQALATIKRNAETQGRLVLGARAWRGFEAEDGTPDERLPPANAEAWNRFASLAAESLAIFERESATDGWRIRASQAGSRRLGDLIAEAEAIHAEAAAGGNPDETRIARTLYATHELIERMEERILTDAGLALDFSGALRTRLMVILGLMAATAVLCGVLGQLLIRRWVLQPVAELRSATVRFGKGDFSHRVRVRGDDEVAQLSREVNQMAGTIATMQDERVQRERLAAVGEMMRRLAHNMRNPLAGIRGLAELTREDVAENAELKENQQRIIDAVDRFEAWLADLLRATSPLEIRPEATAVRPWLAKVRDSQRPMAQAKGVILEVDEAGAPESAEFDPRHLEHALVAILDNAIAATPAGGRVRVACRANGTPGSWEIEVEDGGSGIPADLRERIFLPGFTTKSGGTGTGLAVAQQIVRAHQGRIVVESEKPRAEGLDAGVRGACFVVRLPGSTG